MNKNHLALLLRKFTGLNLLQLSNAGQTLRTQQTSSPVPADFVLAIVVVDLDSIDNLGEVCTVGGVDLGQGNGGAGLATN